MESTEIRSLIRSILSEELGKVKAKKTSSPKAKSENVRITNDQELTAFTKRVAALCKSEQNRNDIETGQWSFSLNSVSSPQMHGSMQSPAQGARSERSAQFEKGFINERQIDALSEDTTIVVINKAVRFTPLAKDRLRQRGIRIERKAS
ncbi:MAG: hypothetical protein HON65_16395 [Rhodospirillales bacterium]|nr:hypothetical protein [Rhodospirillales bacterium]